VYKVTGADLPMSVAEIRVDPELIQSVRPPGSMVSAMPVASPAPRAGIVVAAVLVAIVLTGGAIFAGLHFLATGFGGSADAARSDGSPPAPRPLAPAASMSHSGAPPMVSVEKAQPPPFAPKTH
jgi:hypothetical protein